MKPILVHMVVSLPILALALMPMQVHEAQQPAAEEPAAKVDPGVIAKLVQQLGSAIFSKRDKASQELAKLDEVPAILRDAANSADPEVASRAQIAVAAITARVEEREFQAMVRDLHKVELDCFVRRIVTDEKFRGDKQWAVIDAIVKAVTNQANKVGGRKFTPDFDVKAMRRLLLAENKSPVVFEGSRETLILSAGPARTGMTNSIVIVDGDLGGVTEVSNCLLIVHGNVGHCTGIHNCIVLATGNFEGATVCRNSFLQVNNHQIRFTELDSSVLINTLVKATRSTNSQIVKADKGPLQLLKFSPRKTDDQLSWGKEVGDLSVAIFPANQKDKYTIRWKNIGKELLQIPWVRLNSHPIHADRDDLLEHVFLKGADGKLVPGRPKPAARDRGPFQIRDRTVILAPGRTHEETVELSSYFASPTPEGKYQLWIENDIPDGRRGQEWDVKLWSGKIQSNVLDVTLGK